VAARKVPGVVVLGGDVHANVVADLRANFDDPRSARVATEFCGTSISSVNSSVGKFEAARGFNPHVHLAQDEHRGYTHFSLQAGQLQARLRTVTDARDVAATVATHAQFVVEASKPGAHRA
jgi:alkaline phosphatase D